MRSALSLLLAIMTFALFGCSSEKASFVGRWVNKETMVRKGFINSDQTNLVERTLVFDASGVAEFKVKLNGEPAQSTAGKWSFQSDVLSIESSDGKTLYLKVIRHNSERLVIRNHEGAERIYDRLQ